MKRCNRKNNKSYNENKETVMNADTIVMLETIKVQEELTQRVILNGTSIKEELESDPQFARKYFVLTGLDVASN